MKLSRKSALTLRVAAVLALSAALVPFLATPAHAQLANPTIATTPDPTSVTLDSTTAPTLTDTAVLSGGSDPTGTITFKLYYNGGTTPVDTETTTVSGSNSYTTPTGYTLPTTGTVTGAYQWDADYSGDTYNNPVNDDGDPGEEVTVNSASPSLTTTPDPTSVTLDSTTAPTLTDTAYLAGGYAPTGTITFKLYYNGGSTPVDTETTTVSGNGSYTTPTGYALPTTGTVTGTYQWDADYSSDSNNNSASDDDDSAEQVVVSSASPSLTTTPNPTSVTLGTTAPTLKDKAVLSEGYAPTGTITFTLYDPTDTVVDTETVTVNGNGSYTTPTGYALPTTGTVTGTYQWDADYSGDSNNNSASDDNDPGEQVTVSDASPTITTTPNPTSVTLGTTASTLNDTAVLSGGYYPTGSILFQLYDPTDTVIHSETATVSGNGSYSTSGYTLPTGAVTGVYEWDASYAGDTNNNSSADIDDPSEQVTVSAAVVTPPPPTSPTPPAHTTITQTAPFSNSTTLIKSASFTDTLTTTGNTGAVTFTTTSAPPGSAGGIRVSSSGVVTTTGALSAGTYRASGTDSDSSGDTGTWRFSLTVSATAITQMPPTTGTTTTGKAFSGQLKVSGSHVAVTYAQLTGAPHLTVSPSGKVSAPATLVAGEYKATGTVKDTSGDSGTWGFSLTVSATKLAQTAPTAATITTGKAFSGRLGVSGAHGTVTYSQSTGSAHLTVSSSGTVSASATLAAGTYKATGMTRDTYGDTGSWSFTLTVTANKISQIAPTSATAVQGKAFSTQLEVSGARGTVTYTETSGAPQLTVSSSGRVSAPTNLAAGTHKATGTTKDALGDTGTWSFTLTVTAAVNTLDQIAPTTATTTPGKAFSGQLQVSGGRGTVTYAETSGAPDLTVSSSGKISAPASLVAGTYRATGTVKDSTGDTGTWSFALTVGATTIAQAAPTTATTTTGKAFSGQLDFSGAHGKVTYAETTGAPQLTVSSSGSVSAPANLVAGTYKATGTAKDASGDAGAWSFALTVTATTLSQAAPQDVTTPTGRAFSTQLKVSGAHGFVTYAQSTGALVLKVSSAGKVSATATLLAGTYKATGSDRDSLGDTGTWSFDLTIVATKLLQAAPDSARITTGKAFSDQLGISGSHGTVTYAQSGGAPRLVVSSSGKVSAAATLVAGTYKATGTARDSLGDTGTWSFDLTVVATKLLQAAPDSARITTGKAFSDQLGISGAHGTVTYAQSGGAPRLVVSSSGEVSAAATLVAGTYKATGTARDSLGDTGTWSFDLTVVATKLTQVAPDTATITTGKAFTGRLGVSGVHGTVTYAQSGGAPRLVVSSSGSISAAATLVAGTYKATGTVRDSLGDTGNWRFDLTVVVAKLTQVAPDTATNKVGKAFTGQLSVSGAHGTVTYAQSTGAPRLKVSSSGKISAAAGLAAGTYKASGTVKDAYGDTGKWTFTLTVKGAKLTQIFPTSGMTTAGRAFAGHLEVSGSHGAVTYTQLTGAQIMTVLPSGEISAPATLAPATYKITGTMEDRLGDTGTWSFTLIVGTAVLPQDVPSAIVPLR